MTKTGVFVDDKENVYARLLTRQNFLELKHLPVETDIASLANQILAYKPAILALDYRLNEEVGDLPAEKTYMASAVAQHLRDKAVASPDADFPIVLVSAEVKIRDLFDPDRTAHDLFDKVFVKEQIAQHPESAQVELVSLANSYEALIAHQPYNLEKFLAALEGDSIFIDLQEIKRPIETASAPHQVIGFVMKQLFNKPGLLLDAADTGARLGITPESFGSVKTVLARKDVNYTGQLSDGWPRWWAHRLDAWLIQILGARPITLNALERTERLSVALDLHLEPARSPWTGEADEKIAFACASCRRGAEVRHSVNVFEGSIPRYRTARRICWDCVQTDRYEAESPALQVDELDASLASDVRAMDRPAAR